MVLPENTWPGGYRHAMHQTDHEAWNNENYPGTRQLCHSCGEPTGRCEEDEMLLDGEPVCEECWIEPTICDACNYYDAKKGCYHGKEITNGKCDLFTEHVQED